MQAELSLYIGLLFYLVIGFAFIVILIALFKIIVLLKNIDSKLEDQNK